MHCPLTTGVTPGLSPSLTGVLLGCGRLGRTAGPCLRWLLGYSLWSLTTQLKAARVRGLLHGVNYPCGQMMVIGHRLKFRNTPRQSRVRKVKVSRKADPSRFWTDRTMCCHQGLHLNFLHGWDHRAQVSALHGGNSACLHRVWRVKEDSTCQHKAASMDAGLSLPKRSGRYSGWAAPRGSQIFQEWKVAKSS